MSPALILTTQITNCRLELSGSQIKVRLFGEDPASADAGLAKRFANKVLVYRAAHIKDANIRRYRDGITSRIPAEMRENFSDTWHVEAQGK